MVGDAGLVTRLRPWEQTRNPPAQTGTPLAWAAPRLGGHALPGRDYVAVAEELTWAGNEIHPELVQVAESLLYEWLAQRAV